MADATQVQRRRGTESQCEAMTPAEGEIIVDLTSDTTRVGDGLRQGGFIQPNAFHIQQRKFDFAVAGGTGNAITLTLTPVPISYAQPFSIRFKATAANTGAVTVDVNSLGTKSIKKISNGAASDLIANDVVSGGFYDIVYDGTQFIIVSGAGGGSSSTMTAGSNLVASTGSVTLFTTSRNVSGLFQVGPGFRVPYAGTVRASMEAAKSLGTSFYWYRNLSLVGTSMVPGSGGGYASFSQDLSVSAGDLITLVETSGVTPIDTRRIALSTTQFFPSFLMYDN